MALVTGGSRGIGAATARALAAEGATVAIIDRLWAVNVEGAVATVRAAVRVMGEGGRIVTVTSTLGRRVPFAAMGDYAAGKAALLGYTKGWARDLGARNITMNAVAPGPIDTDMNPDNGTYGAYVKSAIPLLRYGRPEEVAAAIVFLASPEASYITGTTLDVDGGQSA